MLRDTLYNTGCEYNTIVALVYGHVNTSMMYEDTYIPHYYTGGEYDNSV
jgi:hypothetical protein